MRRLLLVLVLVLPLLLLSSKEEARGKAYPPGPMPCIPPCPCW